MNDLLTRIREQPREVLGTIAKSMNVRASESAMQAIWARYMAHIALPEGARILEAGCGNGAAWPVSPRASAIDPTADIGARAALHLPAGWQAESFHWWIVARPGRM